MTTFLQADRPDQARLGDFWITNSASYVCTQTSPQQFEQVVQERDVLRFRTWWLVVGADGLSPISSGDLTNQLRNGRVENTATVIEVSVCGDTGQSSVVVV